MKAPLAFAALVAAQASAVPITLPADDTLVLEPGATIEYRTVMPRAGICIGYVPARLNGDLVLIPVYRPWPGDTLPPEFDNSKPPNDWPRVPQCDFHSIQGRLP